MTRTTYINKNARKAKADMDEIIAKIIFNAVLVGFIILFIWVFASWIDIISNNLSYNPVYQNWNFFALIFDSI